MEPVIEVEVGDIPCCQERTVISLKIPTTITAELVSTNHPENYEHVKRKLYLDLSSQLMDKFRDQLNALDSPAYIQCRFHFSRMAKAVADHIAAHM